MRRPDPATPIDDHLMLAFEGTELPGPIGSVLRSHPPAGFTLSRFTNVESATQVEALTAAIERESAADLPLLIAVDQETGQLQALGPSTTWFAGNMALGATADAELAYRVASAVGSELRAVGVTVNYAPVCDVASNPENPVLGIRSFGDDPGMVTALAAATVRGLQDAGVIATAKHFPGKGEAAVDPHFELPVVDVDLDRLHAVELAPFAAAIDESVGMIMTSHHSVPSLTGRSDLPATLSPDIIGGLLRRDLGFDGVVITDALDMAAVAQGSEQVVDVIAALAAGVDLLLCPPDLDQQSLARRALQLATSRSLLDQTGLAASQERIRRIRTSVGGDRPGLEVVGCAEHRWLAAELARRSVTLVRDEAGLLPVRLPGDASIMAVMPEPQSLTPADASSSVAPGLAPALRRRHHHVTEVVTSSVPAPNEVESIVDLAGSHDLVVVGTISAGDEQARLVTRILQTGTPTVTVALRTPFDLASYPEAGTHAATYSILPESLDALADAVFGVEPFPGRLPAGVPGLYPSGHRWA